MKQWYILLEDLTKEQEEKCLLDTQSRCRFQELHVDEHLYRDPGWPHRL